MIGSALGSGLLWVVAALAQEPIFLELEPLEGAVWLGQSEELELRLGVEESIAADGLLSPFRRPLDLPVQLDTRAWQELSDVVVQPLEPETDERVSFVWNGELGWASASTIERDGLRYALYRMRVRVTHAAEAEAGTWVLPPARVSVVYATQFETDFLGERVPVDEVRRTLASPELRRERRAAPRRSPSGETVSGVFGPVTLEVSLTPEELRVGEEFQVEVTVRGDELPTPLTLLPPTAPGWSWLGQLSLASTTTEARWRYDGQAQQAGALELAPFRLWRVDPTSGELQEVRSEGLRLRVLPGVGGAATSATVDDLAETEEAPAGPRTLSPVVPWLLGAALLACAAIARQRMRLTVRAREAASPLPSAAPHAATREPLEAWLAARLGWPAASLADHALAAKLEAQGIPAELAAATASFLQEMDAARYGGPEVAEAAARRDTLQRAWSALPDDRR